MIISAIPNTVRGLMRDIALVIASLDNSTGPENVATLQTRCTEMLQTLDHQLHIEGMPDQERNLAIYAVSALLDESALRKLPETDKNAWGAYPLQVNHSGDYQGGERVYEHISQELARTPPSLWLMAIWQMVLALGFKGKYAREDDPGRRQVQAILDEHLNKIQAHAPHPSPARRFIHWGSFSPLAWALLSWSLAAILYMTLQSILKTDIASLIAEQG